MSGGRLEGVRVLVTRPRDRAQELCFLLEDEGAQVVALPVLEIVAPNDARPLRSAAEGVRRFAWIAFTSPSGVQAFSEAVREAGTVAPASRAKVAAVGPKTAQAAREHGFSVELEAEVTTGAGLAEFLRPRVGSDEEVLLPVADEARPELFEALVAAGLEVTRVAAYRSAPAQVDDATTRSLLHAQPDLALFASPRTAEAFLELTGERGRALLRAARLVAIGPTTAAALERLGLEVAGVAERPTAEGLTEAAIAALRG